MRLQNLTCKGFATAVVICATATFATDTASAETELRLHTFVPAGHIIVREILEPFAEGVAAETDGEVTITIFPSMQLGGRAPELIRQATEGTVDIVFSLPGYTSAQFPRTQMLELPGLRDDGVEATDLLWELLEGGHLDPEFDGLKVLGLWAADSSGIYTRNTAVNQLSDVDGLLLRTPSAGAASQIEQMGATPVGMPMPELYPQLERGVVDGAVVSFSTLLDFRLYEVIEHVTITGPIFGRNQFAVVMNEDAYNDLSPEHQAVIDRLSGLEMSREGTLAYDGRANEAIEFVRGETSVEVVEWSAEEQSRVSEAMRPLYDQWVAEMAERGIDGEALLTVAGVAVD